MENLVNDDRENILKFVYFIPNAWVEDRKMVNLYKLH